jgi:hypothetical protein
VSPTAKDFNASSSLFTLPGIQELRCGVNARTGAPTLPVFDFDGCTAVPCGLPQKPFMGLTLPEKLVVAHHQGGSEEASRVMRSNADWKIVLEGKVLPLRVQLLARL